MQHDHFYVSQGLIRLPLYRLDVAHSGTGEPALQITFPLTTKRICLKCLTDDVAGTDAA